MPSILISGANRGIGLEFVRQYKDAGWQVHATARQPDEAAALVELGPDVAIHELDVANEASIDALAWKLRDRAFDVVVANAGVSGGLSLKAEEIDGEEMERVFTVNALGAFLLTTRFRPHLERGRLKLALAVSSLMSSIASNDWGEQHSYRASKTALNALWRSLAVEWRPFGIACVLLRPGLVKTELSRMRGMEPNVSVSGMRKVIDELTLSDSGRCVGFDGLDVPW